MECTQWSIGGHALRGARCAQETGAVSATARRGQSSGDAAAIIVALWLGLSQGAERAQCLQSARDRESDDECESARERERDGCVGA